MSEVTHITDYYEWTLVCHVCGENEGWSVVLNEKEMIKDGHSLDAGFVIEGEPLPLRYVRGVRCRHCHNIIPIKEIPEDGAADRGRERREEANDDLPEV